MQEGSPEAPAQSPAAPAKPAAPHAISDQTASLLAAGRPKFAPPKPEPPPKPDDQLVDLRDVDKPKNHIVRLPKVIVTEKRAPIFSERELTRQRALTDLALKQYLKDPAALPTAAAAAERTLFGGYAREQAEEDRRLAEMADLKSESNLFLRAGDRQESDALKQTLYDSYLRRGDFGTNAPDEASAAHPYSYLNKADVSLP